LLLLDGVTILAKSSVEKHKKQKDQHLLFVTQMKETVIEKWQMKYTNLINTTTG